MGENFDDEIGSPQEGVELDAPNSWCVRGEGGEIEYDWQIAYLKQGIVRLMKRDESTGEMLDPQDVPEDDFLKLNPGAEEELKKHEIA